MPSLSRRTFLGASLTGLAGVGYSSDRLWAEDVPSEKLAKHIEGPLFEPISLFLTWQRDPTTTMTIQWIGVPGETTDTNIYYTPDQRIPIFTSLIATPWKTQKTLTKPYPMTGFLVYRAELTNLSPGTDYQFRIGKYSPTYRFSTMPAKATDTIHFISGGDVSVN